MLLWPFVLHKLLINASMSLSVLGFVFSLHAQWIISSRQDDNQNMREKSLLLHEKWVSNEKSSFLSALHMKIAIKKCEFSSPRFILWWLFIFCYDMMISSVHYLEITNWISMNIILYLRVQHVAFIVVWL